MTIYDLKKILSNKLNFLNSSKNAAEQMGDLDKINALEQEIQQTQTTLDAIKNLG